MAVDLNALVIGPAISTFGVAVTYYPFTATLTNGAPTYDAYGNAVGTLGVGYAATGVFDDQFREVTPMGAGPFISTEGMEFGAPGGLSEAIPVLGVQLSALATKPVQGDQVAINGTTYVVREVRPDGHGWAKLLLNLA